MNITVNAAIGPGQHGKEFLEIFENAGWAKQFFEFYPEVCSIEWKNGVRARKQLLPGKINRHLQWLTWAAWRRIPIARRYETPRGFLFPITDAIISHYLTSSDLFIGWAQISLLSMRKARRLGAKVLLEHPMANVDEWMRLILDEYEQWGEKPISYSSLFPAILVERQKREYEEADFINVLSSFAKQSFLKSGIAEEKIFLTTLGVDTELFQPRRKTITGDSEKFTILYVGRLELYKGVQYLLEAFSQIKNPHLELCLVGQVLPEMLPTLARFTDDSRIKIVGAVSKEELVSYYQTADLFVFPSVNDAFGLVVLEAMACGVPVITTENTCGGDVVTDGEDGFVIPIKNSRAIKDKIEFFLENRNSAEEFGRKAREKVESNFTLNHYKERFLNVCQKVVSEKF